MINLVCAEVATDAVFVIPDASAGVEVYEVSDEWLGSHCRGERLGSRCSRPCLHDHDNHIRY